MEKIEEIELKAHRNELIADMKGLVDKYRAIFGWDIPDIDQKAADKLIFAAIRKELDNIEKELLAK